MDPANVRVNLSRNGYRGKVNRFCKRYKGNDVNLWLGNGKISSHITLCLQATFFLFQSYLGQTAFIYTDGEY